jgi:hypothetical protein
VGLRCGGCASSAGGSVRVREAIGDYIVVVVGAQRGGKPRQRVRADEGRGRELWRICIAAHTRYLPPSKYAWRFVLQHSFSKCFALSPEAPVYANWTVKIAYAEHIHAHKKKLLRRVGQGGGDVGWAPPSVSVSRTGHGGHACLAGCDSPSDPTCEPPFRLNRGLCSSVSQTQTKLLFTTMFEMYE